MDSTKRRERSRFKQRGVNMDEDIEKVVKNSADSLKRIGRSKMILANMTLLSCLMAGLVKKGILTQEESDELSIVSGQTSSLIEEEMKKGEDLR